MKKTIISLVLLTSVIGSSMGMGIVYADLIEGSIGGTSILQEKTDKTIKTSVISDEQKRAYNSIIQSLETEFKSLRDSITSTNLKDVKSKIEVLRNSYTDKVKALGYEKSITDNLLRMLNKRFNIFIKVNNVEAQPVFIEENETIKNVTVKTKSKKEKLRTKYKEEVKKQLGTKVEKLSVKKLNRIVVNIDKLIQNITRNTSLSTTKKEDLLAQLEGFKEIINDQLSILSNTDNTNSTTINFDSLLSQ